MSVALFAGLAAVVVGASITWACTPPTFGTPASPSSPPAATPDPPSSGVAPAPTTQAPGRAPSSSPVTVNVSPSTGSSGAGSTSGARGPIKATGRAPANSGAPVRGFVRRGVATAPSGIANRQTAVANSQFAQRANGGTTGVAARGGRAVFGSPAAKATATRSRAASKARTAPSARSASGDLWNGFKPQARASVFAAEAAGAKQGSGAPMTAALVVLGLGLVGLMGSASVLGLRRRRATANATGRSSSGTTEM